MNTPAHVVFGLFAFADPKDRRVTGAAITGALLPDLSLYLLAGWALLVQRIPGQVVFGELYYSDAWQAVFRIDNSFILWSMALAAGIALKSRVVVALCAAALLHLVLDFPFHREDARAHFWPLTDWKFISPVSYWDPAHHGRIVAGVEVATVVAATLWLWRQYPGRVMRTLLAVLLVLEVTPPLMFGLMSLG
ncbi:cobalamin biosynthesis protein CobQ [Loktanella sp. TSTF-M6]|uniref:Cobalamin biosynthesis protein CobQ n=1 Tax=Loktanella gaetbuli TaxID=2881335 RepID=A0ABS8BVW1_9RHOB|nr:cobalamin biosynthesis protein CobQ [Loktanella gaetbuli]MCB5199832.1 cobalamin biosynthesis protein CobQ [Loktanella gaetbuli]